VSIGRLSGVDALSGTVFPVSVVVVSAVPAAVCRCGLCPCGPSVGRCLSSVVIIIIIVFLDRRLYYC